MTNVWDRRNARVNYQVPVGALDPTDKRLLNMVSINLSRGGMFVNTPEQLPVGKELVCNLPMGNTQAMQVRGRVTWHRLLPSDDGHGPRGMGIEFLDLSADESHVLDAIVGDPQESSHPVRMQLEGMGGTLSGQAQLTQQGVFIRTALPFLQLNSQVDFAFDDDEQEQSCRGRIVDVKVHRDPGSPVPRLQLELELLSKGEGDTELPSGSESGVVFQLMQVEHDDTERTSLEAVCAEVDDEQDAHAQAQDQEDDDQVTGEPAFVRSRAQERAAPRAPAAEGSVDSDERDFSQERASDSDPILLLVPKERPEVSDEDFEDEFDEPVDAGFSDRRLWAGVAAVAGLVIVALAIGSAGDEKPAATDKAAPLLAHDDTVPTSEAERVRAIIERSSTRATAGSETENRGTSESTAADSSEERRPAVATGGPVAATPKAEPKPAPTKVAISKPVKQVVKVRQKQTIGGVSLQEDSAGFVLRVPIEGSLERAEHYDLANPDGIAINLPYAQPSEGYHETLSPEIDSVRKIWLRERLGGLHMRVYFQGEQAECSTSYEKSEVVVRCTR